MKPFFKTMRTPVENNKGFTLMEIMIVTAIFGVLSAIAYANYIPIRKKAFDSAALSDARNLVDSIINAALDGQSVDYTKINAGGPVGDADADGNPRRPVFTLSPGVEAVIAGDSAQAPNGNTTVVIATLYHTNGTTDPLTPSGKKEYVITVDEGAGVATVP